MVVYFPSLKKKVFRAKGQSALIWVLHLGMSWFLWIRLQTQPHRTEASVALSAPRRGWVEVFYSGIFKKVFEFEYLTAAVTVACLRGFPPPGPTLLNSDGDVGFYCPPLVSTSFHIQITSLYTYTHFLRHKKRTFQGKCSESICLWKAFSFYLMPFCLP